MTRRLISTGSPFEKTMGYSRAVVQDNWCFVSGTTGYDYTTMTMPDDVVVQTKNCFATIEETLRQAGFALSDVVRVHYYVTDASHAEAITPVLGAMFGNIRPAATMLVCELMKSEMKIEIEVTALKA